MIVEKIYLQRSSAQLKNLLGVEPRPDISNEIKAYKLQVVKQLKKGNGQEMHKQ